MRYCKSTIFQANHNITQTKSWRINVVCDTAKVRFFKQITTLEQSPLYLAMLFAILQKYDFSSKSQPIRVLKLVMLKLFAILQKYDFSSKSQLSLAFFLVTAVVCDTAKVRFFKQITTLQEQNSTASKLFAILQKYDFSSKSQQIPQ